MYRQYQSTTHKTDHNFRYVTDLWEYADRLYGNGDGELCTNGLWLGFDGENVAVRLHGVRVDTLVFKGLSNASQ